jgi:hypothetical protein
MQDLEDRLKSLGDSVARDVPSELRPTERALRRIRVGRATRSGGVLVTVVALVVGGFAGARSLSTDAAPIPPAEETEDKDQSVVDVPDPKWVKRLMNMKKTTFVSPINGYSFTYLDRGGLDPAKELWDPANGPPSIDESRRKGHAVEFDVVETGYGAHFMSASTKIPDGVSVDEWVDEVVAKYAEYLQVACYEPRSQQERITIDWQPGRITDDCEVVATVVKDGRLYLFKLDHGAPSRDEARQVFDAWIDTIDLTPETAAVP